MHWLKANANIELPKYMCFVDTESNIVTDEAGVQTHTLRLGVAHYLRARADEGSETFIEQRIRFNTAESFWRFLADNTPRKSRTWVFAHNWNYDAGILGTATHPARMGFETLQYINDKPPFIVRFRGHERTFQLVDTLNYFMGSLDYIGKSIGIPKGTMPEFSAPDSEWYDYCEQDVEVIKQAILQFRSFVNTHDLGNFQPTLASQSFTAYRHRFMETPILIHDDERVCSLEREAYKGGRSECFFLGERNEPLYYLDVNSMYPHVMQAYPYPVAFKDSFGRIGIKELRAKLSKYLVIAHVKLDTDEPVYPVRYQKRLAFPIGEIETVLSTPELEYALEHDHLREVYFGAKYSQDFIFDKWVDYFYTLRQKYQGQKNPVFSYLCKIMLNSLYGKFGQNGKVWNTDRLWEGEPIEEWVYQDGPDSEPIRYRVRLGLIQKQEKSGESDNSFPGLASHVTAYGRMLLWQYIMEAGREHVFYCDTDSLVVDKTGYERLSNHIEANRLGGLKLERTADSAVFWGAKDYRFGDIERHKGIRPKAIKLSPNEYLQDKFISWDVLISQGKDGFILVEPVKKTLHRHYRKGLPTSSGWVDPHRAIAGSIVEPQTCARCGQRTWEYANVPVPVVVPKRGERWASRDTTRPVRPYRKVSERHEILCSGCLTSGRGSANIVVT